ncbi:hypothetical protein PF003_g39369 [Phytophthora fragariae]|nr:hypothetical protein PF003_g39369 [Phytophthora fragariae]
MRWLLQSERRLTVTRLELSERATAEVANRAMATEASGERLERRARRYCALVAWTQVGRRKAASLACPPRREGGQALQAAASVVAADLSRLREPLSFSGEAGTALLSPCIGPRVFCHPARAEPVALESSSFQCRCRRACFISALQLLRLSSASLPASR